MLRLPLVCCVLALTATVASAQQPNPTSHSVAFEADVLAYGLPGYSGIFNLSLANGFQVAVGAGRYTVPGFLLSGDENYDAVKWKATSTSIQVVRVTYRFRGPMQNGPAAGLVLLNQRWRLRAENLIGESTFSPLSVGATGGYYFHIGRHFYLYPTAAYTRNTVHSGDSTLQGVPYKVEKWGPNGSLHAGWDWEWKR
jgi:hypothetical protein